MSSGYQRLRRRVLYENPWLRFEAHDIVHPNGRPGEHGLVVTPRAAGALVLDGDDVVFTEQPRFGIDAVTIEIVKGGTAPGETELAGAQRETREEVGIVAARWDDLGRVFEIPSIVQEPVYCFLARDCTAVPRELEPVESIVVRRMPFADALTAAHDGRIDDAVTVVALYRAAALIAAEASSRSTDVRAARARD